MGWKNSREDLSKRGGFVFLKDDGDTAEFIALTEPEPDEVDAFNKGEKPRRVYVVKVLRLPVEGENVARLEMGSKAFRSYDLGVGPKHEIRSVVRMTRHGKAKSQDTTYAFKVLRKAKASEVKLAKKLAKEIDRIPF